MRLNSPTIDGKDIGDALCGVPEQQSWETENGQKTRATFVLACLNLEACIYLYVYGCVCVCLCSLKGKEAEGLGPVRPIAARAAMGGA